MSRPNKKNSKLEISRKHEDFLRRIRRAHAPIIEESTAAVGTKRGRLPSPPPTNKVQSERPPLKRPKGRVTRDGDHELQETLFATAKDGPTPSPLSEEDSACMYEARHKLSTEAGNIEAEQHAEQNIERESSGGHGERHSSAPNVGQATNVVDRKRRRLPSPPPTDINKTERRPLKRVKAMARKGAKKGPKSKHLNNTHGTGEYPEGSSACPYENLTLSREPQDERQNFAFTDRVANADGQSTTARAEPPVQIHHASSPSNASTDSSIQQRQTIARELEFQNRSLDIPAMTILEKPTVVQEGISPGVNGVNHAHPDIHLTTAAISDHTQRFLDNTMPPLTQSGVACGVKEIDQLTSNIQPTDSNIQQSQTIVREAELQNPSLDIPSVASFLQTPAIPTAPVIPGVNPARPDPHPTPATVSDYTHRFSDIENTTTPPFIQDRVTLDADEVGQSTSDIQSTASSTDSDIQQRQTIIREAGFQNPSPGIPSVAPLLEPPAIPTAPFIPGVNPARPGTHPTPVTVSDYTQRFPDIDNTTTPPFVQDGVTLDNIQQRQTIIREAEFQNPSPVIPSVAPLLETPAIPTAPFIPGVNPAARSDTHPTPETVSDYTQRLSDIDNTTTPTLIQGGITSGVKEGGHSTSNIQPPAATTSHHGQPVSASRAVPFIQPPVQTHHASNPFKTPMDCSMQQNEMIAREVELHTPIPDIPPTAPAYYGQPLENPMIFGPRWETVPGVKEVNQARQDIQPTTTAAPFILQGIASSLKHTDDRHPVANADTGVPAPHAEQNLTTPSEDPLKDDDALMDDDLSINDSASRDADVSMEAMEMQICWEEPQETPAVLKQSKTYKVLKLHPDVPATNAGLAAVMEEILAGANAPANTTTRSGAPSKARNYGTRRPADENNLKCNVRELANILLGEQPWMIPTTDERMAFERHPTLNNGPTVASFRLDLGRRALRNPWNKHAAEIFADEFIARKEYDCQDHDKIHAAFLVYLTTLQTHYRKHLADDWW